jgi:hypothetical protein
MAVWAMNAFLGKFRILLSVTRQVNQNLVTAPGSIDPMKARAAKNTLIKELVTSHNSSFL